MGVPPDEMLEVRPRGEPVDGVQDVQRVALTGCLPPSALPSSNSLYWIPDGSVTSSPGFSSASRSSRLRSASSRMARISASLLGCFLPNRPPVLGGGALPRPYATAGSARVARDERIADDAAPPRARLGGVGDRRARRVVRSLRGACDRRRGASGARYAGERHPVRHGTDGAEVTKVELFPISRRPGLPR